MMTDERREASELFHPGDVVTVRLGVRAFRVTWVSPDRLTADLKLADDDGRGEPLDYAWGVPIDTLHRIEDR